MTGDDGRLKGNLIKINQNNSKHTIPDLANLFARHGKAALAFSGGKDSLVCLHLCRAYRDQIEVVWVNTGAMFPHMEEFVRKATEGFNFVELKSDVMGWREKFGDPADVVPTFNSFAGLGIRPTEVREVYQPWTTCCLTNRAKPIAEHIAKSGATLTIHGQRRVDPVMGGFMLQSAPEAEVETCGLIEDWSDEDVTRYLAEHGIELPHQYSADPPAPRSLECWSCTRVLNDSGRLAYMHVHHPELYRQLKSELLALFRVAHDATEKMGQILGAALLAQKEDG